MKAIRIIMLLLISCNSFGQYEADDNYYTPERMKTTITDRITIKCDTTTQAAFISAIKTITVEGYTFIEIDKDLLIASTDIYPLKSIEIKINIFADDRFIILTGKFRIPGSTWSKIENRGMKNSPARNAWNELNRLSNIISGKNEFF